MENWAAGPPVPPALREALSESRRRGLVGPSEIEDQVSHSRGFSAFIQEGSKVLDLGSGGGLPGMVLAVGRPDLQLTLLDASLRRTRFLTWAVERLEAGDRVSVVHGRAEEAGLLDTMRERFDVVVSRSFGPPAVAAECARPFLVDGGTMVVSNPPRSESSDLRWPPEGLATLGLMHLGMPDVNPGVDAAHDFSVLEAFGSCPPLLPRRPGVPARKPAF